MSCAVEYMEHTAFLLAVKELPFNVGKSTLVEIVCGAVTKKMVSNDTYMDLAAYGKLEHLSQAQARALLDKLVQNGYLVTHAPPDKPYFSLVHLTPKGAGELKNPSFDPRHQHSFTADRADEDSKKLMEAFAEYLEPYNREQRHAIVCPAQKVLCVAGAGSGKTTVLTKRAEFLARFAGVAPKDILAITFTRKARKEMQERLKGIPVAIATFNGFCERLLRAHGRDKPVVSYAQKIRIFHEALKREGLELKALIHEYFSSRQQREAGQEELARRLVKDVYSILDHYANEDQEVPETGRVVLATTLLRLARRIQEVMDERGVRDYSGQLTEALALLREQPGAARTYQHVLVDEYQDINHAQHELLALLNPAHLFVVGDPRQSIFGWRGSHVEFIQEFPADVTIQLKKNYRSQQRIVSVMNKAIARMGLPDLESARTGDGAVQVLSYSSEDEEAQSVASLVGSMQEDDVFVLARTNQQLKEVSSYLKQLGVPHNIKHEEDERVRSGVVLATVHAIKGLEARVTIVMGVTSKYFPCKVSDHPVVDLIKDSALDREEEERRLLYVALSRAEETLIITHFGSLCYFLDGCLEAPKKSSRNDSLYERLRKWRSAKAAEKGLPAYTVLSDKALRGLTESMPHTRAELLRVHGIGPSKADAYGKELLALITGNASQVAAATQLRLAH